MKDELEIQKLQAEIAKLQAETAAQRPSWIHRFTDSVKVIGAVFAALAAGYAAFETYRVTQVETKLATFEKNEAIREKEVAERDRSEAVARTAEVKKELADLQAAVERAQLELTAARAQSASPDLIKRLDDASKTLRSVRVRGPAAARDIRLIIPDAKREEQLAMQVAGALINLGYTNVSILVPTDHKPPPGTSIVFQRPEDRIAAEQIRELLRAEGVASQMRLTAIEESKPDAIDVYLAAARDQ
jgi:hypothetical protein